MLNRRIRPKSSEPQGHSHAANKSPAVNLGDSGTQALLKIEHRLSCVNVPFSVNNHTHADMYTKGNGSEHVGAHARHMCTDMCKAGSSSKHKTNNISPIRMPVCVVDNFLLC